MDQDPSEQDLSVVASIKRAGDADDQPRVRVSSRGTPYVRPSDIYKSKIGKEQIEENLRISRELV